MPNLATLIIQIGVVIGVSRLVAVLFQKMQQPKVMGEMFAGIMLGPSLLGWVAPHVSSFLFPASSLGYLNALSQVGVVIYMFLVGLALNPKSLRKHGHTAVLTSHVSIIAPFVLGASLALYLYPRLSDDSVSFTGFALFMGAAMSITAFPVLARILSDRGMMGTRLGSLAIACAAVDDVTGWCILAYIVVVVRSYHQTTTPLWVTLGGLAAFLVAMFYGVQRLLGGFETAFKKRGELSENALALMVVVIMVSAVATERLGLHLLFGSFLAGVIMPKDAKFVRYILDKLETTTVVVLLPLYFAFTGLRTSVRVIQGGQMWLFCGLIILIAISGKLGGSMIAARAAGASWREAGGLGTLMNARGLMELVILNVGLDIGVISPALYSMMVVMALVTTFMTTPLLEWIYPLHMIKRESEQAREREGAEAEYEPA
ncbi:MAG TPA: cation:proton antiporter [Terriglobia bacterium]|jgi:Kef-type K+ transport system membrane component KefB|nr:cation:proton antiporter [Terriglobia bacterium]